MLKRMVVRCALIALVILTAQSVFATSLFMSKEEKKANRATEMQDLQKQFQWWPTDAKPAPIKDADMGGYWWWPKGPGTAAPDATALWGNRGYIYMYKIIFDYKSEELPPPKPQELRPSLLIKNIKKNVKIYFDYNKSYLRVDVKKILNEAVWTLKHNPDCSILITGNCDIRGTEKYNDKLGRQRADEVKDFMLKNGIPDNRIKIVSRGKLDAIAPVTDLVGMQKDRNAQFMIAEVEEVMIPAPGEAQLEQATKVEEGKYVIDEEKNVESKIKVSTRVYTVKAGDTFSSIARKELGKPGRWKNIYELNKEKVKDPNKLKAGIKILIPIE